MTDLQGLTAVRSLSPTAARIFIVILLGRGQSYTGRELAAVLGVREATISQRIRELEAAGMVQYNGYSSGWSLPARYQQMPLLVDNSVDNFNGDVGNLPEVCEKTQTLTVEVCEKTQTLPPPISISLVSSDLHKDQNLPTNQPNAKVCEKTQTLHAGSEITAPRDLETEVEAWLIRGGIVPGSSKLSLLAQKIQSSEYAKAHVLEHLYERRAWEKNGKRGREPGTGTLIYRLERGWAAPVMRCEACLERKCRCNGRLFRQRIPDDLIGIVKR